MIVYVLRVNPDPKWTDDINVIYGVYTDKDKAVHDGIEYCRNDQEMQDYYEERKEEDGQDYIFEEFVEDLFFKVTAHQLRE